MRQKSLHLANYKDTIKCILTLFIIPVGFTLLFGWIYSPTYTENIPLAVYDGDNSPISRSVIDNFRDSKGFTLVDIAKSQQAVEQSMLDGSIQAGLIIPPDFGKSVQEKNSPGMLVLIDGSNIVIGNNALAYASGICNALNASLQVKTLEAGGLVPYIAEENLTTLSLVDRVLFNPQLSYFRYLFAALLAIFIQQTYLNMLTPKLIQAKMQSRKQFMAQGNGTKNLVSLILQYAGISCIAFLSCLIIAGGLFDYPLKGSLFLTLLLIFIFLINMTAMALLIATFFDNELHCVQFAMFLSIPTMLTCGYTWPEFMMAPHFAPFIKAIWPLYYICNPLKDLQLKGVTFAGIEQYIIGGLIFAAIWLPIAICLYWQKSKAITYLNGMDSYDTYQKNL